MANLTRIKPFIPAGRDFGRATAFFHDLGFRGNWQAEGLVELQLGEVVFLLQDFHNEQMQQNLMMYVVVDDLDAWWRLVEDSGVLERYPEVRAKPPTVFPWGSREVHLIDPAGVCWHFAQ